MEDNERILDELAADADTPEVTKQQSERSEPAQEVAATESATADATDATDAADVGEATASAAPTRKKKSFKEWWAIHKPSKRRLIQIYAMLLYNANIRGFIKGEIFTGATKYACVPGLNCYSCPGAVGACPLGALQNALASTGARAPYYVFGIILLYGLIFGRTICGFLCPMGLGQDLLYKIRSPKLKKSRVTRVFSYLKYILLAVLVVAIPIIYSIDQTAVPGFCKYVCPAGTLEGAILLLVNPSNDAMYTMLGALFSWKTVVLIVVFTASIFIYRFFCRFLCPLGAIYGLFNRFSLLGIKVNKSKCTDCGKCVNKCKMDIKHVGDHECINCGECIDVCPTKAIVWKGGKVFMNNIDEREVTPVSTFDEPTEDVVTATAAAAEASVMTSTAETAAITSTVPHSGAATGGGKSTATGGGKTPKKRGRAFWTKVVCISLAAILFVGVFTYVNFFAVAEDSAPTATYDIVVSSKSGSSGLTSFSIIKLGEGGGTIVPREDGADGSAENPYNIDTVIGSYDVVLDSTNAVSGVYFRYTTTSAGEYTVVGNTDLSVKIFYVLENKRYALYDSDNDGNGFTLDLSMPDGFGNAIGFTCYDFTLDSYNGEDAVTLSALRGKVTVINFWATWCGPCVKELPEFEEVRIANDVEVIAVHSASVTEDVQSFIDSKGWNEWGVRFVQDTGTAQDSKIYTLLGGRNGSYPRTLVLDKNGVVSAIFDGSITKTTLQNAVTKAMEAE